MLRPRYAAAALLSTTCSGCAVPTSRARGASRCAPAIRAASRRLGPAAKPRSDRAGTKAVEGSANQRAAQHRVAPPAKRVRHVDAASRRDQLLTQRGQPNTFDQRPTQCSEVHRTGPAAAGFKLGYADASFASAAGLPHHAPGGSLPITLARRRVTMAADIEVPTLRKELGLFGLGANSSDMNQAAGMPPPSTPAGPQTSGPRMAAKPTLGPNPSPLRSNIVGASVGAVQKR
jgi:hypothetical protein